MSFDTEWWKKFYKGTWQHVQPLFRTSERTQKDADFIEDALKLKPPAEILDVPCGEGRLTIELASREHKMCGIDMNENFLKEAKEEADKRGLAITWHNGDMRQIPWKDKFDVAICMWSSFGYFDEEGDLEFIKAIGRSLKKGGKFLLDTQVAETLYPKYQSKGWTKVDDVIMLADRSFDHTTGRNEEDYTFIQKGKQTTYHSSIRIYTYREVVDLLRQNGFSRFEAFGSFSKDAFKLGATRLLITARRI